MTIKTRGELLQFLRAKCAYTGKSDLAEVEAFITEQGVDLVDAKGKAVNVKDVWAKTVSLTVSDDDTEEVQVEDEVAEVKNHEPSDEGRKNRADLHRANAAAVERDYQSKGAKVHRSNMARKAYDAKAIAGKTRFADADTMEVFNAGYRLKTFERIHGISEQEYPSYLREEDRAICGKVGSEVVNTLGGALFAQDFRRTLKWSTESYGVVRYLAEIDTAAVGGQTVWPRKTALNTWYAVAQGDAATASDITFDNVTSIPKQWMTLNKQQRQVFQQAAISINDVIADSFAESFWRTVDGCWILGDGTSTYNGDVGLAGGLPSTAIYTPAAHSTWLTLDENDLLSTMGLPVNVNQSRVAWLCSRQFFVSVFLRLAQGKSGNNVSDTFKTGWISVDGNSQAMGSYLGTPVYFSDIMPTATAVSSKCAYYGDFTGGSMITMRTGLEITPSEHAGFTSNQIWTRGVAEFSAQYVSDGRASSIGPVACLKTHS